jgi:hypothetical protein
MDSGTQDVVSVAMESTYGTAVTPTTSIPINPSDGLQVKQDVNAVESIKGTLPKNKLMYHGKTGFEGAFELASYPSAIGFFLKSAFGAIADTTLEASTSYKHTFTEASPKPGMTLEQKIGANITKRFSGALVKALKLTGKAGDLITLHADMLAKGQADATAITASFASLRPFNFADIATLSIAGTDIKGKIDSFEIDYDNATQMFYGLGSTSPQDRYSKGSTIKGKLETFVDSATASYLADLIAGTERALILDIVGDAFGATSHYELKVTISQCNFTSVKTPIKNDYNAMTIEFEAREDATNGLIKVELTNGVTTY